MKNLHVAALATLFGISAMSGLFVSTTAVASADQGDRGNGRQNRNNGNGTWQNNQNGQCNTNGSTRRDNGDNDGDEQGNRGNRGAGHGQKRGWQNPNNPHYCGNGNNCRYNNAQNNNGGYNNGQYNGKSGQNGQYNCNPNGNNGRGSNSVLRGTITGVNGNQVRLMAGFGQSLTINDQPALDNQQTGRVVVGRYVTAYGYYQNGVFYATSLQ